MGRKFSRGNHQITDRKTLILLSISTNKLLNRPPTHNQITSESISRQCAAFVQLIHDTRYEMATCGYSELVGGPCGCSSSNPANAVCETIERCGRNIKSHLKFFDCFDSTLQTEADLLLARAGNMSNFLKNIVKVLQGINNVEDKVEMVTGYWLPVFPRVKHTYVTGDY